MTDDTEIVELPPLDIEKIALELGRLPKVRDQDVTASVSGALVGAHPYMTRLKLHLSKRGVQFDQPDDRVLRRGRRLEPAIALGVADAHPDWQIEKNPHYYRCAAERLGATPDYFVVRPDRPGRGVLQCKSVYPSVYARDWHDGDLVPLWIQLQVQVEMMMTGASFAIVAVATSFDLEVIEFEIEPHPGAQLRLLGETRAFWLEVFEGREPAPDFGKDSALLKVLAPREDPGKTIDLSGDNELPFLCARHKELLEKRSEVEDALEKIKTEIKFKMRAAERVVGVPNYSITWKMRHYSAYTVPERDTRVLTITPRS